nr:hypothetical protein [Bacteroidota bacterium]
MPFNFPVAYLNIGYDLPGNASGGRRPWMDIGTYYSSNSDHMYTGLLDMGSNRKDAIVNFGDDPQYNAFDNIQTPKTFGALFISIQFQYTKNYIPLSSAEGP